MHIITKSPLTSQGSVFTVGGGERNVFTSSFRTSQLVSENFGIKVSGQYLQGDEWRHADPSETAARTAALRVDPNTRIGQRDFDLQRWTGEVRADWRVTDGLTAVVSAGASSSTGIELHGVGASQVDGWGYNYFQTRVSQGRFFGQVYLNSTDSGANTFQLWTGLPVIDKSRMMVGQLQHGLALGERQDFTYGVDYIRTMPDTEGSLHGVNEDNDTMDEVGAYLQSQTRLSDRLNLVLAGRVDSHSGVENPVFSPRAALVLKPSPNHSIRATYNQAFSTPGGVNLFLDFDVGAAPSALGQLGYRFHPMGNHGGFSFRRANGAFAMRSPFTPAALGGPAAVLDASSSLMYQLAIGFLQATKQVDAQTAQFLLSLKPQDSDIGVNTWNVLTNEIAPLAANAVADVPPMEMSKNQTYEMGYKGLLGDRVMVAADVWYSQMDNFTSRPQLRSPLLLLNGADMAKFFVSRGLPAAQAQALATGLAKLPVGTLSPENMNATAADMLLTYVNFGKVELYGADVSAQALLSDRWSLGVSASLVSDEYFQDEETDQELIPLNAPDKKGALSLGYRDEAAGLTGELRARYSGGFPASTGVHLADRCVSGNDLGQECIEAYSVVDLAVGYRIPRLRSTALQLSVTNLFDDKYRSFAGTPEIGRLALMQLRYEF